MRCLASKIKEAERMTEAVVVVRNNKVVERSVKWENFR